MWEQIASDTGRSLTSTSFDGQIWEHKWQQAHSSGSLAVQEGGGEVEKGVWWEKVEEKPGNASFLALLA